MTADRYAHNRVRYHAVIVGGGIYGSLVAKRLSENGWKVLILEAGTGSVATWEGYSAAVDDYRAALHKSPNSPYLPNPAAPSPDNTDPSGYFVQQLDGPLYASDYLRTLGGTTLHWEGVVPRMHEGDFLTQTRYGVGKNWPLKVHDKDPSALSPTTLAMLHKYYSEAEFELGVAGDAKALGKSGVMVPKYTYPMKNIPQSYLDRKIAEVLPEKIGYGPHGTASVEPNMVPAPQARNSSPNPDYRKGEGFRPVGAIGIPNYGERCQGNSSCIPICPVQAKYTPLRTQSQFKDDLVTVATRSVVSRVLFHDPLEKSRPRNGRATGVEYKVYEDPRSRAFTTHYAEADIVVLAAHAIENAKLLLASGVDNKHIGRNLMDHPLVYAKALMPDTRGVGGNIGPHRGPPATSFLDGFRDGAWRVGFSPFRAAVSNWGWGGMADAFSHEVRALVDEGYLPHVDEKPKAAKHLSGRALRRKLAGHLPRQFQMELLLEQPANENNTVTISPDFRDNLGNFRPVIKYAFGSDSDYVVDGARHAVAVARELFTRLGAKEYGSKVAPVRKPGDEAVIARFEDGGFHYDIVGARHGAGTHIMGLSADDSVVDEFQRSHNHPNLYAVGCGSMPAIGTSNPTLTGAAMALRSADQIHSDLMDLHNTLSVTLFEKAGQ
ncbi:GMC family oxidoreductase [Streptomyces piniterrae]|uniref:GMC family oxidoreductase n=1 Tax=Streptomyces piniterrae TaxID=2571125 RepID=A0A4U0NIV0_9ACTN|nr:GMC family oxidoreductase [Streptomyces piniterrae]TJZ54201.1 GMC family oxidoreductase [Streptomyces piniterrae]